MIIVELKETIYQKETSLLSSKNRSSADFIKANLAHDFKEFGSSGNIHRLDDVIRWLKNEEAFHYEISNFDINPLSDTVILATYQIVVNKSKSLRSSIWVLEDRDWKVKFHQGTPTNEVCNAFEAS